MMSSPQVLEVALYGRRIGTLTLLPGDQTLFVFWHRAQTAEQIDESVKAPIQQLLKDIPLVRDL